MDKSYLLEKKLVIFGAGGNAKKATDIAISNGFELLGYISQNHQGSIINNYKVLGYLDEYHNSTELQSCYFHIAIGEIFDRHKIFQLMNNNKNLISLISKDAIISKTACIDIGTTINNCTILPQVKIGQCCIIDTGAIIEHDSVISDFVNVNPGVILCGNVEVDNYAFIGAGSTVIENIKIGENSIIGAGSVVINDIEPNVVAVGNPAKVIRRRKFLEKYLK